jgi:20S proteasome alpha/beta subunit
MDHNGGSVIAMAGKDCVAIASDLRLGAGAMTVAMNFEKVSFHSAIVIGHLLKVYATLARRYFQ